MKFIQFGGKHRWVNLEMVEVIEIVSTNPKQVHLRTMCGDRMIDRYETFDTEEEATARLDSLAAMLNEPLLPTPIVVNPQNSNQLYPPVVTWTSTNT